MEILERKVKKEAKSNKILEMLESSKFSSMKELTEINPNFYTSRLLIYVALVGIGFTGVFMGGIWIKIASSILLGLMYAHAIELQHQALHFTAYRSKSLNRFVGVILGIPMLVSFTDYQVHHWSHHKNLGTEKNKEFFNYSYEKLRSPMFLIPHLFMVYHYVDVVKWTALSLIGKVKPDTSEIKGKNIRTEYIIMFASVCTVVGLSIYFNSLLAIWLWAIPLAIAIPIHALIELPEHLGCPQLSTDPFENTRTIKSTFLGKWFTNYNNYHVEHHFLPGVPNDKAYELHKAIENRIIVLEPSFASFYWWFIKELATGGKFDSIERFKANIKVDSANLVKDGQ